jgi:hypothetical protein
MSDPQQPSEIADTELEKVQGGNRIDPITNLPNYTGPKLHAPTGSIAQGDTLDNTLTEDNLP